MKENKFMKVIAINGSARKKWNTATLLSYALKGAAAAGAETELVHLYDLNFKGCISCFACKQVGGMHEGRCAVQDDATPVLKKIEQDAEVLILGSPIYFGGISGEMHSFLERLLFAPFVYDKPPRSIFPRRIKSGFIYTMNVSEESSAERGYRAMFMSNEGYLKMHFGHAETFCAYDTCQMEDFSKVVMEYMDPAYKLARREQAFPEECKRAFEFGRQLVYGK
jgi:multimeric flavodoxin WrbA